MSAKRKWIAVIALAVLIGYLYVFRVTADEVVVHRMVDFEVAEEWVFTDKKTIKTFTYAARFAKKQRGIVDIAAEDYRFYLNGKEYKLWLSESFGKGTLMKPPNTGKVYTISKSTTNKLKEILGIGK